MTGSEHYKILDGAKVVVTGGLGFIGSSLVRRLITLNSDVLVLDNRLPGSGANPFNLERLNDQLTMCFYDIRDIDGLSQHLRDSRYLFNLAAHTSHQGSMTNPLLDVDVNCRGQLGLLEVCRDVNPEMVIVFASTRQIYGRPDYLPVDEGHPIKPVDVNGVSKAAGEAFQLLYHRVYGMRCCSLRLTNTYGPRMRITDAQQSFIGEWIRRIVEKRPIEIWGGGQLRDFLYVDDAVEAFLTAALHRGTPGQAFNVDADNPVSLLQLAELLIEVNGSGRFEIRDFPSDRKPIDIGDYYGDDSLFRSLTGWSPNKRLNEGLAETLAFFRENLFHYI